MKNSGLRGTESRLGARAARAAVKETDRVGRRAAFMLDGIPLMAGTLMCSAAHSVLAMVIGRVVVGVGIGVASAIVPLYVSEVAQTTTLVGGPYALQRSRQTLDVGAARSGVTLGTCRHSRLLELH